MKANAFSEARLEKPVTETPGQGEAFEGWRAHVVRIAFYAPRRDDVDDSGISTTL